VLNYRLIKLICFKVQLLELIRQPKSLSAEFLHLTRQIATFLDSPFPVRNQMWVELVYSVILELGLSQKPISRWFERFLADFLDVCFSIRFLDFKFEFGAIQLGFKVLFYDFPSQILVLLLNLQSKWFKPDLFHQEKFDCLKLIHLLIFAFMPHRITLIVSFRDFHS
jgi:hypothetical protein